MLELRGVSKRFEAVHALKPTELIIKEGEFFSLLGPSGCGKTTLLRILGGFEFLDSGEITFQGNRIDVLPSFKRPFNTVFQRYALFPHLNVFENVAFGLRVKKVSHSEVEKRVQSALELVRMGEFKARKIPTLSGGQQQRIALARALINEPKILLLDEPLSALDLKLRQEMQVELLELQKRLKITFIFVTHDQEEAMALSNRMAVMNDGQIEQVGSPSEIYDRPKTKFVAEFIGVMNQLGSAYIRPEKIRMSRTVDSSDSKSISGKVIEAVFQGPYIHYFIESDFLESLKPLRVFAPRYQNSSQLHEFFDIGTDVVLQWDKKDAVQVEY